MFWSLNIENCDLFVIWCLKFGILLSYKTKADQNLPFITAAATFAQL
ncbi:hypothetical protein D1BOALGB6SA_5063 [Olavius sp. associated proteobacterium Delta 1]|nr:hypothetical protein D1BOALGB6SA_5063 [Olavius sp. associated proteobacterium Delta 1]